MGFQKSPFEKKCVYLRERKLQKYIFFTNKDRVKKLKFYQILVNPLVPRVQKTKIRNLTLN